MPDRIPLARCTATKKSTGERCKNKAIPGGNVCRFHGGAAPHVRESAAKRVTLWQATVAAEEIGVRIDIGPQEALLDEVARSAGMCAFYEARVKELSRGEVAGLAVSKVVTGLGENDFETLEVDIHFWLRALNDERDRLVRVCSAAIKGGVEERRVRIAEQQGEQVAAVIRRIIARLALTDEQTILVGTVVPEELRALGA